jgi:hypothetical protein
MHAGMGGPHVFVIDVTTNDPTQRLVTLTIKSNWVP